MRPVDFCETHRTQRRKSHDAFRKMKISSFRDKLFVFFLWQCAIFVIFTGINSIVFCSIFLPYIYPNDYGFFDIIKYDMVAQYWKWPIGRMMIGINVFLFVFAGITWFSLKILVSKTFQPVSSDRKLVNRFKANSVKDNTELR